MMETVPSIDSYLLLTYGPQEVLCPQRVGVLLTARDKLSGKSVAIKQVKSLSKQTLRELKLLRLLRHENIRSPERVALGEDSEGLKLVKIWGLMDSDLGQLIAQRELTDEHCQFFLYQMLRGLKFMHSSAIAHRSLSPRHVMVNSNCELKLSHMETACSLSRTGAPTRLPESQMDRWYLSPERLLGQRGGSKEEDIWSVGCIFGEMLLKKPVFPGQSASDQLQVICNIVGGPTASYIDQFESEFAIDALKKLSKLEVNRFNSFFSDCNSLAKNLLSSMLAFNPEDRISVEEALEHEYLSDFHDYEDEPTGEPLGQEEFAFEVQKITQEELKTMIAEEVRRQSGGWVTWDHTQV